MKRKIIRLIASGTLIFLLSFAAKATGTDWSIGGIAGYYSPNFGKGFLKAKICNLSISAEKNVSVEGSNRSSDRWSKGFLCIATFQSACIERFFSSQFRNTGVLAYFLTMES